jgi:hypothetical protein
MRTVGLELLQSTKTWSDAGLMSWPVAQSRHYLLVRGASGRTAELLLREPTFRRILELRVAASAAAAVSPMRQRRLLCTTIALTGACVTLRAHYGLDGADQVTSIVLWTCGLAGDDPGDVRTRSASSPSRVVKPRCIRSSRRCS